ncbi:MAG: hypothetical protein IJ229_13480 [Clostridia bacterium]|nr:hypothetical protein [Clostridia bacterium]
MRYRALGRFIALMLVLAQFILPGGYAQAAGDTTPVPKQLSEERETASTDLDEIDERRLRTVSAGLENLVGELKWDEAVAYLDSALLRYPNLEGALMDMKQTLYLQWVAYGETNQVLDDGLSALKSARENLHGEVLDRVLDAVYGWAEDTENAGNYVSALTLYTALADARNLNGAISRVQYAYALQLKEEADYLQAIENFTAVKGYLDAADQIKDCTYLQAQVLLDAGDYAGAHELYASIFGYKDTAKKIIECHYVEAVSLKESGKGEDALPIFHSIIDYKDVKQILAEDVQMADAMDAWRAGIQPGEVIRYGHAVKTANELEWLVLDTDPSRQALLVLQQTDMELGKFMDYTSVHPTWHLSTARSYLNDAYLQEHFTPNEIEGICLTYIKAEKNPDSSFSPGNDTEDQLFLLSMQEAEKYADVIKSNQPFLVRTPYWTRSPGTTHGSIVCYAFSAKGESSQQSAVIVGYLRPAMWVMWDMVTH